MTDCSQVSQPETRAAEPAAPARPTYIPAELTAEIERVLGTDDYAPYVLDGQSAALTGEEDEYHDVIVHHEDAMGASLIKFTMNPDGHISHYRLAVYAVNGSTE